MTFKVDIRAPKEKVWDVMLGDKTYREWTNVFQEGSYYEGSWEKGSDIRFLAPDNGKVSGMFSKIVENKPYEYISIEHLGEVIDGQNNTLSENAQQWAGSHENYFFREANGITTVTVELEGATIGEEMKAMFESGWPKALQKLKEIAEA